IRAGAFFVGTNPDKTLPVPEGEIPGNGALLALLEAASGVSPLVIGKPEKHLYEIAMRRLGAAKETTAALGDRLETDILGASRAGLFSIMVLSGVSTREQALAAPYQPDLIFQDVGELAEAWRAVLEEQTPGG
ncbi:MAG: HAD hydrolase-like protein, partial [Anaerolineae bacterium]|nr:HAD hydrolase-like protein [Anaerolineae bacterium]